MDYRKVGNSGVQVSCICLGAAFRGFTNGRTDEQTSRKTIERAVDLGINFIDCANFYFVGKCEELLGKECPVLRGADENSCCPDGPRLDSVIPRGRRPAGATATYRTGTTIAPARARICGLTDGLRRLGISESRGSIPHPSSSSRSELRALLRPRNPEIRAPSTRSGPWAGGKRGRRRTAPGWDRQLLFRRS